MCSKTVLTVKEMAKRLGISTNIAYGLVRQTDFPSIRLGEKRIVIPVDAFNKWLDSSSMEPID